MGLDLIVAADSRSGGQDGLEARAAAKLAGTPYSSAARDRRRPRRRPRARFGPWFGRGGSQRHA